MLVFSSLLLFLKNYLSLYVGGGGQERKREGGGRKRCCVMGPRVAAHMLWSRTALWSQFSPTFGQVLGIELSLSGFCVEYVYPWGHLLGPLLPLLIQSGTSVHGIVPPTFRQDFPFLVKPSWKYPPSQSQRCVPTMSLTQSSLQ